MPIDVVILSSDEDAEDEPPSKKMPVDVVVILSSDEESTEDESPPKKVKSEEAVKAEKPNCLENIRIESVTSLAKDEKSVLNNEVVVIDDDDEDVIKSEPVKTVIVKPQVNGTHRKFERKFVFVQEIPDENDENKDVQNVKDATEAKNGHCDISSVENRESASCSSVQASSTNGDFHFKITPQKLIPEFEEFLKVCLTQTAKQKYDFMRKKVSKIKEKYFLTDQNYLKSKSFRKFLVKCTDIVNKNPNRVFVHFNDVYQEMKVRSAETKDKEQSEITEKQQVHLKKLNKCLRSLQMKIKKLEEEEVDFDDEENSTFIQLERYKDRICAVHKKICSYTREDPHASRVAFRNLDFAESKYPEINRTIDKLYRNTRAFPRLDQVDQAIRKTVEEKNLNLSGPSLDLEIRNMFTKMGELIQRRRKSEVYDNLSYFLGLSTDPSQEDPMLKKKLDEQFKAGEEKLEALFQSYTDRQEKGENPTVSSDTDDSDVRSETDKEDGKKVK